MDTTSPRLIHFPISFFSVVMGMVGLSIAVQKVEEYLELESTLSTFLIGVSAVVFSLVALLYLTKVVRFTQAVIGEFNHPIKLHFFPAISISLLLFSIALLAHNPTISFIFWALGAGLHLLLTLTIISMWIQRSKFEITHMNPSWFIPAVGNIIVPIAGMAHDQQELSWFFFSIGFVFWIILLVVFFNRIIFHNPLPNKLLPTFFILIAPPAVGFISYFKLTHQIDGLANVLYYFALFMLLLLLVQIRLFARIEFFLSWWAYSFPIAAMTIATFLMHKQTGNSMFEVLAFALLTLLSLLILGLSVRTLRAIMCNEICVEEH